MPRLPGALGCALALAPRQASAPSGRGNLSRDPRSRLAQLALRPTLVEEPGDCGARTKSLRVLSLAPVPVGRLASDRCLFRTHMDRVPAFRRSNRSKLADALQRRGELGAVAKSTKSKKAGSKPKASAKPAEDATAPLDATANAALAGQAALAGTRAAGKAVTLAAARAGVPLAAGGGLAAGVAGGLAVVRRRRRRRAGGFDVASAAERVGTLGEEVGRVAIVIQKAADGSKRSK